jgi:PAS domain S-box-containing protein
MEALTRGPFRNMGRRFRWRRNISLRTRLLLLVMASVVPLVCLGVFREYLDYRTQRAEIYDGLLAIARTTALAVERDLQLRISSLETLAMSPALQESDLASFDHQADIFLKRLQPGTLLGIATPDRHIQRLYGMGGTVAKDRPLPEMPGDSSMLDSEQPVVTDLQRFNVADSVWRYGIDVPVIRDGRVFYDLFLWLPASTITSLITKQNLPPESILTIADTSGIVVGRIPSAERFVSSHIVPALWADVQARAEGVIEARTLEGIPAIAAHTRIAAFNWTVVVGSPERVVFAPMREAIISVSLTVLAVLGAGFILAVRVAREITRPINQLRRLAEHDDWIDLAGNTVTGLPETDVVARALMKAAAKRQEVVAALGESETRFRALFERSPSGTVLLDPITLQIVDSNTAAAGYVGYTIEELKGRSITDFALETSPEQIRALCNLVVSGEVASYETRVKGRLGPRDLLIAIAPVQVSGRTQVLINQIDVTELRRVEAGLRINEERLELAREGANLGIWDWDVVHRTLSWSLHQWELHGLEPRQEAPTAEIWRAAVHPDDLARTQQELVAALKSPGRRYATEYSVLLPDGSKRRLLARGLAIRGADGRAVRMVGINMDVTARYEAELARDRLIRMLEAERSRLAEIIEAVPLAVGIFDTKGRVLVGNAMMTRLNGSLLHSLSPDPRGEWVGFRDDGSRVSPEDYPVRRALRLGETTVPGKEFRFRDSDGKETWFRVASLPLRRENGQVQEALGVFLDIDAERRLLEIQHRINAGLEQQVREEMAAREAAQKRAAHAERMHALGQIAGGIAHDFNNVLQAVSGGAALIERRPGDPERVLRYATMVLDAARRGAAITSRLLAFSRRGDLRAENIDAAALLTDLAEVLTHTLGGSVVCGVDLVPHLPPLFADRGQLETVLVNLATNARDAMPSGGTLTLSANTEIVTAGLPHTAGLGPGRYVRIEVKDTGTGMDQAVLARVTEPFFTTKETGKGTGLGLAMAKGFVEQSGGSLSIESAVGQGTRVILWLPGMAGPMPPAKPVTGGTGTKLDQPCVLLVDDDPAVRDVLALSLEEAGYMVVAVKTGADALVQLSSDDRIDIIVSDLTMPVMDGLTLIKMAQAKRPNLPAVVLTGYAGDGARLAIGTQVSGSFSVLRKPVSGTRLVDHVSASLAAHHQESEA